MPRVSEIFENGRIVYTNRFLSFGKGNVLKVNIINTESRAHVLTPYWQKRPKSKKNTQKNW